MTIGKLAQKVMQRLTTSRDVNPEDLENVTDAYKGVYDMLADMSLVTWAYSTDDEADIPDRFILSLTILVAAEIADFYAAPPPPEGWLATKTAAVNQIRKQIAPEQPTETVQAEYM